LSKFNIGKCKVIHIGHNFYTEYFIEDEVGNQVIIEQITIEKDLGIYVTNDLKPIIDEDD